MFLRGYKEIAAWLASSAGVTLTPVELCRYSKWNEDPLPIVRPWQGAQGTGRVFAKEDALAAWARRRFGK